VAIAGGQILGDEYTDHVIKVCAHSYSKLWTVALIPPHTEQEWHHPPRKVYFAVCYNQLDLLIYCFQVHFSNPTNGYADKPLKVPFEALSISGRYLIPISMPLVNPQLKL
jgi:hypothetical protein